MKQSDLRKIQRDAIERERSREQSDDVQRRETLERAQRASEDQSTLKRKRATESFGKFLGSKLDIAARDTPSALENAAKAGLSATSFKLVVFPIYIPLSQHGPESFSLSKPHEIGEDFFEWYAGYAQRRLRVEAKLNSFNLKFLFSSAEQNQNLRLSDMVYPIVANVQKFAETLPEYEHLSRTFRKFGYSFSFSSRVNFRGATEAAAILLNARF